MQGFKKFGKVRWRRGCWNQCVQTKINFFAYLSNVIINKNTNATFIALVPKNKKMTSKISYCRPISLVKSLYKIIAIAMSGRLRRVLMKQYLCRKELLLKGDKF